MTCYLTKVISGGQTGVDQAALYAAYQSHLEIGGWCPPGRKSEDGKISDFFPLKETPQECSSFAPNIPRSQRTEWNVRDSDGTLIIKETLADKDLGVHFTETMARHYKRPTIQCLISPNHHIIKQQIIDFIYINKIKILNVAGPSAHTAPTVGQITYQLLIEVFREIQSV